MGRKKKGLAAIFYKPKLAVAAEGSPPWPWPSCANNPQTASFHRQDDDDDDRPCTTTAGGRSSLAASYCASGRLIPPRKAAGDMYKTVNSVYLDPADSSFRYDDEVEEGADDDDALELELDDGVMSYSTTTASEEWSEAVIRSLGRRTSTDRFFFDSGPPPASNSILAASRSPSPSPSPGRRVMTSAVPLPAEPSKQAPVMTPDNNLELEGDSDSYLDDSEEQEEDEEPPSTSPLVEESVAVALDSSDPYGDFRASMEEMVTAHGLRDWPSLQEMLLWYLRINGKHNHALIVGAFVDLLVGLAASTTSGSRSGAATTTTTTAMTATTETATRSSSSSGSNSVATCSTSATVEDEEEQCGSGGGSSGRGTDASYSPDASSSDQEEEDEEEPVIGKMPSDDEL